MEDAVPAAVYLALKYHDDPEAALIANTNLGGDNAGRGAVLGALLGADRGLKAFPERWVSGLVDPPPDLKDFNASVHLKMPPGAFKYTIRPIRSHMKIG